MNRSDSINERSFSAAQDFILSTKTFWTTEIFPQLDKEKQAEEIEKTTTYKFFAWLERHLQRYKYSGRYGIYNFYNQRREKIKSPSADEKNLKLDPSLKLPRYYTQIDIHQHPGGLSKDKTAGYVYEHGARSTTPLGVSNHQDLHHRFTNLILASGNPKNILDMACGFGKSTQPFYKKIPEAKIIGIDLSEPCLTLGSTIAKKDQAANVTYMQVNAEKTNFKNNQFDLVTSTMLLHELPPRSIQNIISEAHRVLKPGGKMAHLDFYMLPNQFKSFIHFGHSKRNNEPYMVSFAKMDITRILKAEGFSNIIIEPFEEAEGVLDPKYQAWRFPWTVISAEKK